MSTAGFDGLPGPVGTPAARPVPDVAVGPLGPATDTTGSASDGTDPLAGKTPKKKRKKRDKAKRADRADPADLADAAAPLGTTKAVETMFRNAIRAELEIIALAATKANIMISLNGFIISALMISGAFLFNSSQGFLVPAGIFMLTSAASIVFALLAASPERVALGTSLLDWMRDVRARKARLRDLRAYVMRGRKDPQADDFNLLIYEDRVNLDPAAFWTRMQDLLRDRDQIYQKMSDQLYWLGQMANRKFKLLNISYTIFRWGLLASIVVFFGMRSAVSLIPGLTEEQPVQLRNLGIAEFEDIYEPSAVQQITDGRLLVVEDEATRAVSLLGIGSDGNLVEDNAADLRLTRAFGRKLSDLEGLTAGEEDFLFAVTSHSATNDGERQPDREQLLRFRIRGNTVSDVSAFTGLREALAADRALAQQIAERTGEEPNFNDLNIEGLSYRPQSGQLLLGLREPMLADQSLIVVIENPVEVLNGQASPDFGDPILLDLQGGGIRALSFDPVLGAFLIVNEIEGNEGNRYSQLWSWTGEVAAPANPLALPDIINLNNVESIDSVTIHGEQRLLLMSDEGSEQKDEPARYMILDYGQLGQAAAQ